MANYLHMLQCKNDLKQLYIDTHFCGMVKIAKNLILFYWHLTQVLEALPVIRPSFIWNLDYPESKITVLLEYF